MNSIEKLCKKYESLGSGTYGQPLAGRYLFALSREVQEAVALARQEKVSRENRLVELEALAKAWKASFACIENSLQGTTVVPMTPAAVSARLEEQDEYITELEEKLAEESKERSRDATKYERDLAEIMATSRQSSKENTRRHQQHMESLTKSYAASLADEKVLRERIALESRAHRGGKEANEKDLDFLEARLAEALGENAILRSRVEQADALVEKTLVTAKAESLSMLKRREFLWKHEFHSFQAKVHADPESERLRRSEKELSEKLARLKDSYEQEVGGLKRQAAEQSKLISAMRGALGQWQRI